jgi:hypothetical protein
MDVETQMVDTNARASESKEREADSTINLSL